MSYKITERSLYKPIGNVLQQHGIKSVQEVVIENQKQPDLLAEVNGQRFVVEVKINRESKLLEDIPQAWYKASKLRAQGFISLLFPSRTRQIHPDVLESVAPELSITTAIAALTWVAQTWKDLTLEKLGQRIEDSYRSYVKTRIPVTSYDAVVSVAREAVIDIASSIRNALIAKYTQDALAIVGRFDIYRATLRDFGVKDDEMNAWIADIASYLTINQILFYHIISQKKSDEYRPLPEVNPFDPDECLVENLRQLFSHASRDFEPIFGPDLLSIIKRAGGKKSLYALARYIITLKALRPEHIKGELLGRLYQESIPPEARKNLGAFFTKPKAARILALLSIGSWNEKVLDPACGSGTLLTETYQVRRKLSPIEMDEEEIHRKLLEETYGIDIMHFANHMTSINLLAQPLTRNLVLSAKLPNIKAGDGLEPTLLCLTNSDKDTDPAVNARMMRLEEWMERKKPQLLPCELFDQIIMNPPFTRRERISEISEVKRLEKLFREAFEGDVVRGKVGYWAYFVAAADKVLKPGGRLAIVTPEEFFAGGDAESLRRFLFLRETHKREGYTRIKDSSHHYDIDFVVRSAKEVAFSEASLYRDYLLIAGKRRRTSPMVFVVLKKPLGDLDEEAAAAEINKFSKTKRRKISAEDFEAIKFRNVGKFISKHIGNLKPLVGFNNLEAQTLFFELADSLADLPTLGDLDESGDLQIRVYNPGQFKTKGVEDEARKLFVRRYRGRGKALFKHIKKREGRLRLSPIGLKRDFEIDAASTVPSLRTYSRIKKIDITGEEEYAIVKPNRVPQRIRSLKGMLNMASYERAAKDIESAYRDLSGDILLVRRAQMPSPGLYWLAYHTSNHALGTTSAMLNLRTLTGSIQKGVALYLNSTIALLQLIGYVTETRGAWITLHGNQTWKHIHVPEVDAMVENGTISGTFDGTANIESENLLKRLMNKDPIQKRIDEVSLEMIGLSRWKGRLDEIYGAIIGEFQAMLEILERSRKPSKRKVQKSKENKKQRSLGAFV